jgi:hypothetical protein
MLQNIFVFSKKTNIILGLVMKLAGWPALGIAAASFCFSIDIYELFIIAFNSVVDSCLRRNDKTKDIAESPTRAR